MSKKKMTAKQWTRNPKESGSAKSISKTGVSVIWMVRVNDLSKSLRLGLTADLPDANCNGKLDRNIISAWCASRQRTYPRGTNLGDIAAKVCAILKSRGALVRWHKSDQT